MILNPKWTELFARKCNPSNKVLERKVVLDYLNLSSNNCYSSTPLLSDKKEIEQKLVELISV